MIKRSVARRVAEVIKNIRLIATDLFDSRYYPPRGEPLESVARYLLAMVAIDHRTSRPGRPYEAHLDDGFYHGADLLYRMGAYMYREDPEFFSPKSLSRLSYKRALNWLRAPNGALPFNVKLRVRLLRDLGSKLASLYGGSVLSLMRSSGFRVSGIGGLRSRLKVFTAYQDPVEKKANLFLKFLVLRGVEMEDPWSIDVPVDNHLTRIAIRLGLVEVPPGMLSTVTWRRRAEWWEDVVLRLAVRRAYRLVSDISGRSPYLLDDFLWSHGRRICTLKNPRCQECPFRDVCSAYESGVADELREPLYYNTWYY